MHARDASATAFSSTTPTRAGRARHDLHHGRRRDARRRGGEATAVRAAAPDGVDTGVTTRPASPVDCCVVGPSADASVDRTAATAAPTSASGAAIGGAVAVLRTRSDQGAGCMTFNIGNQNAEIINNVAGDQINQGGQQVVVGDIGAAREQLALLRAELARVRLPATESAEAEGRGQGHRRRARPA